MKLQLISQVLLVGGWMGAGPDSSLVSVGPAAF